MAAMSDVPEMAGKKMAVGARHRLSLRARVSMKKMSAKPPSHAISAILYPSINILRGFDPSLKRSFDALLVKSSRPPRPIRHFGKSTSLSLASVDGSIL